MLFCTPELKRKQSHSKSFRVMILSSTFFSANPGGIISVIVIYPLLQSPFEVVVNLPNLQAAKMPAPSTSLINLAQIPLDGFV